MLPPGRNHARLLLALIALLLWPASATRAAVAGGIAASLPTDQRQALDALLPATSPAVVDLLEDGGDGQFDEVSLLRAALIAGGIDNSNRLADYEARFARWSELAAVEALAQADAVEQARVLYERLHAQLLSGDYEKNCSDPAETLDRGAYNCLSATILYQAAARRIGLRVSAIESPAHVFCALRSSSGSIDIQTTSPRWFEYLKQPGYRPDDLSFVPGAAGSSSGPRREITDAALIAMVFYNRGVDLLAQQRFAEALAANEHALRLDPASTTARGNLLASLNNWSVALADQRRYAQARTLLLCGLALEPTHASLLENDLYVHGQWIDALCESHRYEEALSVLAAAARRRPDARAFSIQRREIERQISAPQPRTSRAQ